MRKAGEEEEEKEFVQVNLRHRRGGGVGGSSPIMSPFFLAPTISFHSFLPLSLLSPHVGHRRVGGDDFSEMIGAEEEEKDRWGEYSQWEERMELNENAAGYN